MIADPSQVKEPGFVDRKLLSCFVILVSLASGTDRIILVDIGRIPFLVRREVAEDARAVWFQLFLGRFEDGLALELTVGGRG